MTTSTEININSETNTIVLLDELSTSLQNLTVFNETNSDPFKCLKKDSIVQFKLHNSDELQTV